jgi:DNA-binding transcriptional LysR family regulator
VQSQIADLSGIRRGHVRIASGADALRRLLPETIATYRAAHPAVSFDLVRCYGDESESRLFSLDADIALIFAPIRAAHVHVAATLRQQIHCVMPADHRLAAREQIRLRDLAGEKLVLPTAQSGVRQLLDTGLLRRNVETDVILESDSFEFMQNFLHFEPSLFFQIPIAIGAGGDGPANDFDPRLVARPIHPDDVPAGTLHICHLKGRVLPVAAAKFLDDIITTLRDSYHQDVDQ